MARQTTCDEERTRDRMKNVYNAQKRNSDGWNDWGMFTAHVVHGLIQEVAELRAKLEAEVIDSGPQRDPFEL